MDLTNHRWPAEWEPHAGTLITWPVSPDTWPEVFPLIPAAFARFIATVARFEPVWVLAAGDQVAESARPLIDRACESAGNRYPVTLLNIPVNDSWCRDYGPTIVMPRPDAVTSAAVAIDWKYNAWGGKYPPWDHDARVASDVARHFGLSVVSPEIVMEGGAIDGDGAGTLLTTTSCLLNPNRNPELDQNQAEMTLKETLGASTVIWLPGDGLPGDDTDGHIDQLARFVEPGRVVVAEAWNEDAPEAAHLRANRDAIESARDADGRTLTTIPLRIPSPAVRNGQRQPMSYCNFYLVNGAVLVPTFEDAADNDALQTLQSCFPQRRIVQLDSTDLVAGLGSLHCLSQQIPANAV